MHDLQSKLHAEGRYDLSVILQSVDGGGKDSTIRRICGAVNPQGCTVTAFKEPSREELSHDFLWRVHARVPAHGRIAIFNRSHYEEVLVPRVEKSVSRQQLDARYRPRVAAASLAAARSGYSGRGNSLTSSGAREIERLEQPGFFGSERQILDRKEHLSSRKCEGTIGGDQYRDVFSVKRAAR